MADQQVDERISDYINAIEHLQDGHFDIDIPLTPADSIGQLGIA